MVMHVFAWHWFPSGWYQSDGPPYEPKPTLSSPTDFWNCTLVMINSDIYTFCTSRSLLVSVRLYSAGLFLFPCEVRYWIFMLKKSGTCRSQVWMYTRRIINRCLYVQQKSWFAEHTTCLERHRVLDAFARYSCHVLVTCKSQRFISNKFKVFWASKRHISVVL